MQAVIAADAGGVFARSHQTKDHHRLSMAGALAK
jgi:hypothetical protein